MRKHFEVSQKKKAKYRCQHCVNICAAIGSTGVIFVLYQMHLCLVSFLQAGVPRDMKNFSMIPPWKKRLKNTNLDFWVYRHHLSS
jgi:hypothetical protein